MTVIARIVLYHIGAALAAKGFVGAQELYGDPEVVSLVEIGLGAAISAASVLWWRLAKRFGWRT